MFHEKKTFLKLDPLLAFLVFCVPKSNIVEKD